MELEGYSRPTYNKLVHSATTRSTVVGVIHKQTVDDIVLIVLEVLKQLCKVFNYRILYGRYAVNIYTFVISIPSPLTLLFQA